MFWYELSLYLLAAVVATALALTVMALGPGQTLNRLFASFALAEGISALSGFIVRLTLWSGQGYPDFWNELRVIGFCVMGPLLLAFAARYVGRRPVWTDRAAALGLVSFGILSIPLFRNQLVSHARFDAHQLLTYDISSLGLALSALPTLYYLGALILLWHDRRRTREPYLAVGVFILLFGFVVGGLLQPPVPVMAFTSISGVLILSYGILSRQLLNPLRELTTHLERKVTERTEALRASEALAQVQARELAAVLDAVPVPVLIARDAAAHVVSGNRAARALLQSGSEVDDASLFDFEAAQVRVRFERNGIELTPAEQPLVAALRGETIENQEIDIVTGAGVVHTLGNAVPLRDAAGRIYGALSTYADITQLTQAEEAVRASEARLRTYIDHSPIAIFVAGPGGRYVDANPAACALTGYSRAELLQLTMFDMVPPPEVAGVLARLQGDGAFVGEVPLLCKDGAVLSILRSRVRLPNGHLLSFCTDITARKRAEALVQSLNADLEQRVAARTAELRLAIEAAEAANRAKSAFLAIMGHELRTPLNTIFLAAEMLRERPLSHEEQKGYSEVILVSGRRLLQMVEGVLEYTATDIPLALAPVDITATLKDIAARYAARSARKGQTLNFDIAPDLPPLLVNLHQFDAMVRRLLDNAIKFTPQGGRVAVTARREGSTLRLTVTDTGIGLRSESLQPIFEPFVQLETSHLVHSEGAGLGLTLARRQAEAHGGRLWATSPGEGQGATFILELPVPGLDQAPSL